MNVELTPEQLAKIEKYNRHQEAVKRASAKYYAKKNGKDYVDHHGKLHKFSESVIDEHELNVREERKQKRKEYHKERYSKNADRIKQQAKDYRAKKKQEKLSSKTPLLLSEPVSV